LPNNFTLPKPGLRSCLASAWQLELFFTWGTATPAYQGFLGTIEESVQRRPEMDFANIHVFCDRHLQQKTIASDTKPV